MKLSPTPTTHPLVKAFFLGTQGEGKSGSTVPLAIEGPIKGCPVPGEGFELRVLDYDSKSKNGGKYEEIARAILGKMLEMKQISQTQHDEALCRIDICVCYEPVGVVNVNINGKTQQVIGVKGVPTAWKAGVKQLGIWDKDFSAKHILITDSLTHAGRAVINYAQDLNNMLNQPFLWRQYSTPQQYLTSLVTASASCNAHAIICGHQKVYETYRKTGEYDQKGDPIEELIDAIVAPVTVGRSGASELPSQSNHCLVAASEGAGKATKRYIHTKSVKGVIAKSPFLNAKDKYPIETGWVEYFALRK